MLSVIFKLLNIMSVLAEAHFGTLVLVFILAECLLRSPQIPVELSRTSRQIALVSPKKKSAVCTKLICGATESSRCVTIPNPR